MKRSAVGLLLFYKEKNEENENMENYKIRYSRIQDIVNEVYGLKLVSPFEYVEQRVK